MPLSSYRCEKCGKRNNYIVELDSAGEQIVACTVCGHESLIDYQQLPQRVKDTIRDLENDAKIFDDEDIESELMPVDTVDETLAEVEKRFQTAKDEMASFDNIIGIKGSISRIADEYVDSDVLDSVSSFSSSVLDETGQLRDDWKQRGFTSLVDSASELTLDDDSTSARIVSYIQQVIQSGRGMEAITDVELMKSAGLDKKEKFLIKQAAKNNQISSILQQVLGEESF